MLEAVAGAGADQPDVGDVRVAVDQEVAVPTVRIGADPRVEQRGVAQGGHAPGQDHAGDLQAPFRDDPIVAGGRVEVRAVMVEADLEPPPLDVGDAVDSSRGVDPGRHRRGREPPVARVRSEEEDLLPRGVDALAEEAGEDMREPRAAGEDVAVGHDVVAGARLQRLEALGARGRGQHPRDHVVDAPLDGLADDALHRPPREDDPGRRLEQAARDGTQRELRVPSFQLGAIQHLERDVQRPQVARGVVEGGVVPPGHPQHAGADEEILAPVAQELLPRVGRVLGPARVQGVPAVAEADEP